MFVSCGLPSQVRKRIIVGKRNVETLTIGVWRIRRRKPQALPGRTALRHRDDLAAPRLPHTQLIKCIRGYTFKRSGPLILKWLEIFPITGPFPGCPKNRQDVTTVVWRFLVVRKS